MFGNDGKLYFTTGDHFQGTPVAGPDQPARKDPPDQPGRDRADRQPVLRRRRARTSTRSGRYGLRNPLPRLLRRADGQALRRRRRRQRPRTANEEVNVGAPRRQLRLAELRGPCASALHEPALLTTRTTGATPRSPAASSTTATQFPSSYQGSYFFADYAQNWIKRLTFDADGNVNGVFNFEPPTARSTAPTATSCTSRKGPDGALYYLDLGYSDTSGTFGVSKIRRIRYSESATSRRSRSPRRTRPLGRRRWTVTFSSAGSSDPEGQPLTYAWTFGDGAHVDCGQPDPHVHAAGPVLGAADGLRRGQHDVLDTDHDQRRQSADGDDPGAHDGATFRAGDVISFSGNATDPEDGTLPASAFTWTIDFLHAGHVHPGARRSPA